MPAARLGAVAARSSAQPLAGPCAAVVCARAAADVPARLPRPAGERCAAAEARSRLPHRGQPQQPPRCPGADVGVRPAAGERHALRVRGGLLLRPSDQADHHVCAGQRHRHGPHARRRPDDPALPPAPRRRRQHRLLSRGHAIHRRADPRLSGRHRPARAEVRSSHHPGGHPRRLRVLLQGPTVAPAGADRGGVRPADTIPPPQASQARLVGRCRRPAGAGPRPRRRAGRKGPRPTRPPPLPVADPARTPRRRQRSPS